MSEHPNDSVSAALRGVKRMVVKVGTRVIDDENTGFNRPVIESLTGEIAELMKRGVEVMLVSSGAVGAGMRALKIAGPAQSIHLRQAFAAIGQGRLMHTYTELFARHGIHTAQVLLTGADLDRRESYLNARETLQHLLTIGVLPIINENDTVALEGLKFSDNDQLAALVAGKMNANLLVLLTTVDGIMRSFDPDTKTGDLIDVVDNLDEIEAHIHETVDAFSMGGMKSKFEAMRTASSQGVLVAAANGRRIGILGDLMGGRARATWLIPGKKRLAAWKSYLAFAKRPSAGRIAVDEGAEAALREQGRSLLASGVREVRGPFERKDLVPVATLDGRVFARGLVNYSSGELERIRGRSTREIAEMFDIKNPATVIHRDNLVLL